MNNMRAERVIVTAIVAIMVVLLPIFAPIYIILLPIMLIACSALMVVNYKKSRKIDFLIAIDWLVCIGLAVIVFNMAKYI